MRGGLTNWYYWVEIGPCSPSPPHPRPFSPGVPREKGVDIRLEAGEWDWVRGMEGGLTIWGSDRWGAAGRFFLISGIIGLAVVVFCFGVKVCVS